MEERDGVPGAESVEARLAAIERRLDALTARLERPVVPPPVVRPERMAFAAPETGSPHPSPIERELAYTRPAPRAAAPESSAAPPPGPAHELEYKLGVFGLIRGGAAVVVVGIVFLVALALANGWITPRLQFVGEILLALGFLGYGWHRRQDREEFGLLLMGVGSCGLYLSSAGGYVFKHLYAGKVVVLLFLILSFANLAFGAVRRSRSFWAIGMVGGLIAAAMPLHEARVPVALTLYFLILIPAAVVAARARWTAMVATLASVATAFLVPMLVASLAWPVRVAVLDAHALILAAAFFRMPKESSIDPLRLTSIGLFLTGAGALLIQHDAGGLLHIPLLALAIGGLALLSPTGSPERRTLVATAVVVAAVLTPFALRPIPATFAFGGIAILGAGVALAYVPKGRVPGGVVGLVWAEFWLALGAFAVATMDAPPPAPTAEATLLVVLMTAVAMAAIAGRTVSARIERLGLTGAGEGLAGLLIGAGFVRLVDLARTGFGVGATTTQTVAFGTLLFAALAASIAIRWRWVPAAFVAGAFGAVGVATTFGLAPELTGPGTGTELLFGLGAAAVVGLVVRAIAGVTEERVVLTGAAVLALWALLSRGAYVGVALMSTLERGSWGITFAWIAFAAALLVVGFLRDVQRLRYWGFAVFGATVGKVFLADLAALNPAVRVAILLALGLTMIACGTWYLRGRATSNP